MPSHRTTAIPYLNQNVSVFGLMSIFAAACAVLGVLGVGAHVDAQTPASDLAQQLLDRINALVAPFSLSEMQTMRSAPPNTASTPSASRTPSSGSSTFLQFSGGSTGGATGEVSTRLAMQGLIVDYRSKPRSGGSAGEYITVVQTARSASSEPVKAEVYVKAKRVTIADVYNGTIGDRVLLLSKANSATRYAPIGFESVHFSGATNESFRLDDSGWIPGQ